MILYFIFLILFLFLCFLLSAVILIQESKSLGLGSSFGGNQAESLFGTSTAQVLKKFTAALAIIFLSGSLVLSIWTSKVGRSLPLTQVEQEF